MGEWQCWSGSAQRDFPPPVILWALDFKSLRSELCWSCLCVSWCWVFVPDPRAVPASADPLLLELSSGAFPLLAKHGSAPWFWPKWQLLSKAHLIWEGAPEFADNLWLFHANLAIVEAGSAWHSADELIIFLYIICPPGQTAQQLLAHLCYLQCSTGISSLCSPCLL